MVGLLSRLPQCSYNMMSIRAICTTIQPEKLKITQTDTSKPKPKNEDLVFGHAFTDHMLEIDYTKEHGWGVPKIKRMEPFQMDPAAKVLHYAPALFEGMKAYRCVDDKIRLFRPMENMARMTSSAIRCGLPTFGERELLNLIKKLVAIDKEWVPYSDKCSLYIRPTLIGTEPTLGLGVSTQAKLFVINSPVGPYFPKGLKPVGLLADTKYVRAWTGGCGAYKMASNYASTLYPGIKASELGLDQNLWLFGDDHEITEAGTTNFAMYWVNEQGENELITPPLDSGLILPGVTRKSVLQLAQEWNEFKVSEKKITMSQLIKGVNEGRVKEVFGMGTAAVICPVNKIVFKGENLNIPAPPENDMKGVGNRLMKELTDMHYYRRPHDWMEPIDE